MHRHLLIVGAVLVVACDTTTGPDPVDYHVPVLEDFVYAPQRVVYSDLPPEQIVGFTVELPISMSVRARAGSSPIREVRYILQQGPHAATRGVLEDQGGDLFAAQFTLTLSALEESIHTLLVYAVDAASRLSGEARGTIIYVRSFEPGEPPVLEELFVPDTVQRPAAGQPAVTLSLAARVSDPDGLQDIHRVEFWNAASPETRLLMCDDGNTSPCGTSSESGDKTAGDGIYTRQVFILSTNNLGVNTLVFQVSDRALLMSKQVEREVEIVAQ